MFFGDSVLDCFRRKLGSNFRKKLGVYNYKIGHQQYHKKPGVVPLHLKEKLQKENNKISNLKLKKLERESPYPYGKWVGKKFFFDEKKVPFFNVPDLTGFKLKPYVSVHTPRIEPNLIEEIRKLNDFTQTQNFGRYSIESSPTDLVTTTKKEQKEKKKEKQTEKTQEIQE